MTKTTLFTNNEEVILNDSRQTINHALWLKRLYEDIKRSVKDYNHITYQELHELWKRNYDLYHPFHTPTSFEKYIRAVGLGKKYKNVIGSIEKVGYRKCFDLKNRPMGKNYSTIKDAKGGVQRINSAIIEYHEEEGKTSPLFYKIGNYKIQSYIQIPLFKVVEVKAIPIYDAYEQETGYTRAYIVALNKEIEEYFEQYEHLAADYESHRTYNKARSALKSFLRTCKFYELDYEEILDSVNLKELNETIHIEDKGRE